LKTKLAKILAVSLALGPISAFAASIDVLWYTGGVAASGGTGGSYAGAIAALEAQAESAFNTGSPGNTWNVTLWSGGAMPAGSFNVLVSVSPEGSWNTNPNYTALTTNAATNDRSDYGDRVMLTGQDADWHYIYGPGAANFNGPAGFLINSINWAGSGTGMGAVFLGASPATSAIFTDSGTSGVATNNVVIPGAVSGFPINVNLTSAGLSNWETSSHREFVGFDTNDWVALNTNGVTGQAITIISKATATGGTTSAVPDGGSTAAMVLLGLVSMVYARRRS